MHDRHRSLIDPARVRRRSRRARLRPRARALRGREAARREGAALLDRLRAGAASRAAGRDRVRALRHSARRLRQDARRGRRGRGAGAEPERAFSTQPLPTRAGDRVRRPGDELRLRVPRLRAALRHRRRRGAVERAARRRRRRRARRRRRPACRRGDRVIAVDGSPIATWEELSQTVRGVEGRAARAHRRARRRAASPLDGHARSCSDDAHALRRGGGQGLPDRHRGLARLEARRAAARPSAWPAQQTCDGVDVVAAGARA